MILVVGYGSSLRGDDAAGPIAAERVAAWCEPSLQIVTAHQLTPELAEAVADARLAIFVDAAAGEQTEAAIQAIMPSVPQSGLGHAGDPRHLLALAVQAFGRCPPAWLVTIPAARFDYGADLSPVAARGVDEALMLIRETVDREVGAALSCMK